jgi:hypothetical protein
MAGQFPEELTRAIESLMPPGNTERRLSVYSTRALYEYFLAPDGTVFERDHDSSRGAVPVEDATLVRVVYAVAATKWPRLASLVEHGG